MTAPLSYPHSPFLYHHVPNSPFLMPRPQVTQSPVPSVPDIDNVRENRHSTSGLLRSGEHKYGFPGCKYTILLAYAPMNDKLYYQIRICCVRNIP